MDNYVIYHLHTDISNTTTLGADSVTKFEQYLDRMQQEQMHSMAFSEHGSIFHWVKKKQETEKRGIKYIHANEVYLTAHNDKERGLIRDNYHFMLIARNLDGVKELNTLTSKSFEKETGHFYYNPRLTFDDLFNTSDNIIMTSACLASPLWRAIKREDTQMIQLFQDFFVKNKHRAFLEIQYHTHPEQIQFNQWLYEFSKESGVPLIAGTDTHSIDQKHAEGRKILMQAKGCSYGDEDAFDLTFKSYGELVGMFRKQNAIPENAFLEAIHNTNVMANMVETFDLDTSYKYPKLYEDEEKTFKERIRVKFQEKVQQGVIKENHKQYQKQINDEYKVFKKLGMFSFMSFLSELCTWCWENNIPTGTARGSVAGSVIAYILDIIDLDPIQWNTVFSRFCNEDRISLGDVDIDFAPEDREKVYEYIINRFDKNQTAYIVTFNTVSDKGTIDEIGRGLKIPLPEVKEIKELYESNPESAKIKYPDVFRHFNVIKDTIVSKGIHPAGMIASPITLHDNIGLAYDEGKPIVQCDMKEMDGLNYVKFDILGLKNISIIKKTFEYLGEEYLKSHQINWNDQAVWKDMIESPVGVFQFEGNYAFQMLKQFQPQAINDMSIVNAALRPSGASYRDKLMNKEFHENPSEQIDELLKDNLGYLIFQEDTIKFLTDVCGFSGSMADSIRRYIGKKDEKKLKESLPKILEGYCAKSDKSREVAEEEAKEFIKIISDSSDYQFGYNHSTGYSMVGYMCAMLRHNHPLEFITAYLNTAANEDDIKNGEELAKLKGINILPVKFRKSLGQYTLSKDDHSIYKGIASIKFLNEKIAQELYQLRETHYDTFIDLLIDIEEKTSVNSKQMMILTKLDFFEGFYSSGKLLSIIEEFSNGKNRYSKGHKDETKAKRIPLLKEFEQQQEESQLPMHERLMFELEMLGKIETIYPTVDPSYALIITVDKKYSPKLTVYYLQSGEESTLKMSKQNFFKDGKDLLKEGDLIKILKIEAKPRSKKDESGKWIKLDQTEDWLVACNIVRTHINKI